MNINSDPFNRPMAINGKRGPSNPTPDGEVDEYWLDDYWFYPPFFDIEFVGRNERWDDKFVEGEMGALKRHLLQLVIMNQQVVNIKPISIYVCIENLQRYYKKKIKELQECLETHTISGTPESTTGTR